MDGTIRFEEYRPDRAGAVAAMWRESREGWPPGFMGASVFTPESVEAEERASGRLFTILALEGERVVGLCRTTPWGGEPDAAYVGLVNVVSDLHGRKIGRNLLLDAVERSASLGFRRIDLRTWPANLKAVPLYKKTGFFWVPDTQVTMQNYMPFLLGRPELTAFLDGASWYACLERELRVEPDEERTPTGREVFTYVFRRGGDEFRAVFDRRGRILSGLRGPGVDLAVERDAGRVWFGVPAGVTASGISLPAEGRLAADPGIEVPASFRVRDGRASIPVIPLPVQVPVPEWNRSPRVIFTVPADPPLEIGLGLRAEEPVSLDSPPVLWVPPGREAVPLDLTRPSDAEEVRILASLDGTPFLDRVFPLERAASQRLLLPLPAERSSMDPALLTLVFETSGTRGAEESLVLAPGRESGPVRWILTRTHAVAVSGRLAAAVSRRGLETELVFPDSRLETLAAGWLQVQAGPPYWNSDLPHQVYRFSTRGEWLEAEADWPSRAGLVHGCRLRLDSAGFLESVSSLENRSDVDHAVHFSCDWTGGSWFQPRVRLIPFRDGLFRDREIDNQVPDIEEDLPKTSEGLGAPWLGLSGGGRALMIRFPGWPELRYDNPDSGELSVPAGGTVEAPPVRLLSVAGDAEELIAAASVLGWETGGAETHRGFLAQNLEPVMAAGTPLTLSHDLLGLRSARISAGGRLLAEGDVRSGMSISAPAGGAGLREVSLELADRAHRFPVLFVDGDEPPAEAFREGEDLILRNARLTARICPKGFGHVYGVLRDGTENLRSAHPGPSAFEWESPWYGGIHLRISDDRGAPFRLDWQDPAIEPLEETGAGLPRRGWRMLWVADHKRFGSFRLSWSVSMLPGVPLLRTVFRIEPLAGSCSGADADLRGFLAPGGSTSGSILTCASDASLAQGRDHAGAWAPAGGWARVTGAGGSFVEAHASGDGILWFEDYAEGGCHLSLCSEADRVRELRMDWLFGASEADRALAGALRAHAEATFPR